ncbi:putative pollen-specific leucine-rich repeat extensin-like protein 3 [Iris pallida]|uniref:Pollen-specific leucine-rich repeat extensin-like protein 3 n=1 Tax=Iris pallida TaxID=29817 RepID=A0AAX6ESQ0_IRIPA|nr:putative pollen-specific leucine-rich repeat extensin-like protein 3 [Iris pallida]
MRERKHKGKATEENWGKSEHSEFGCSAWRRASSGGAEVPVVRSVCRPEKMTGGGRLLRRGVVRRFPPQWVRASADLASATVLASLDEGGAGRGGSGQGSTSGMAHGDAFAGEGAA